MLKARSKLIHRIEQQGPISVSDYISYCLFDPDHGYYRTQSPIGREGDFITAPEVSQLFGEMIGLWLLNQWEQGDQEDDIALVELGPGRGTLMKDLLRVAALRPPFMKNLSIHFLEINPALIALQQEKLKNYPVTWDSSLTSLLTRCEGKRTFVIANEFLDVFPIQQYIYQGHWFERLITYENEQFSFVLAQHPTDLSEHLEGYPSSKNGDIVEISPQSRDCFAQLLSHLSRNKGAMLTIDYGYTQPLYGDSLQAVQQHRYVNVLEEPGQCDLTAHVNFWKLRQQCLDRGIDAHFTSQREFLLNHGIQVRAENLMQGKPTAVQNQILAGLERLITENKMGHLFKVLEVVCRLKG